MFTEKDHLTRESRRDKKGTKERFLVSVKGRIRANRNRLNENKLRRQSLLIRIVCANRETNFNYIKQAFLKMRFFVVLSFFFNYG